MLGTLSPMTSSIAAGTLPPQFIKLPNATQPRGIYFTSPPRAKAPYREKLPVRFQL
jgi:hypothetical protein